MILELFSLGEVSMDASTKAVCHFKLAVLFKLFVNSKLNFGSHPGPEPLHAHPFCFLHFSHLHSPLGKYCCLGYKTIKSQPASEDWGLRETLHASKYMRKGWSHRVNTPSLLFQWQWIAQLSLHVALRFFVVAVVLFCFVKSTFKIVVFCSELFSLVKVDFKKRAWGFFLR